MVLTCPSTRSTRLVPAVLVLLLVACAPAAGRGGIGLGGMDARVPLTWIGDDDAKRAAPVRGPGDYGRKLPFGGRTRFYEIHVPRGYTPTKPMPVVLVFHGGGGYPSAVRYESDMDRVADDNGFIAVYPAGSGTLFQDRLLIWNDGRPHKDGSRSPVDDVGFVDALLDDLATLSDIDPRRIYACGISNGAQFTYRLAKERSDRIAAIATVAGQRIVDDGLVPPPSRPTPIMQFSGKQDTIAPYEGGSLPSRVGVLRVPFDATTAPVEDVIRSWVVFNGCVPEAMETTRTGKALRTRYRSCRDGAEVVLWTLEDGGHTWPGGRALPSEIAAGVGPINQDISASAVMWEFFARHSR